jgi:hypothetical protein
MRMDPGVDGGGIRVLAGGRGLRGRTGVCGRTRGLWIGRRSFPASVLNPQVGGARNRSHNRTGLLRGEGFRVVDARAV